MSCGKIKFLSNIYYIISCIYLITLLIIGYFILFPIVYIKYLITGTRINNNSFIGNYIINIFKKANDNIKKNNI